MSAIIKLLRPHQYIKNLFVFAPILFAFSFTSDNLINTLIAFTLFSLIASSVYVLNDLMDIEEDKVHPKKKFRPTASGDVSTKTAKYLFIGLSSISLLAASIFNFELFLVLVVI